MKKVVIPILFMLGCAISEGYAQKVALKSNLLYDATTTMNLGLEIGLARKWTLDIPVNYNPWKLSDGKRLRHWGIQPEVRYWFCESFRRMFIGMHGHYADFNVGGWPVGYSWILKKRWSIETSVGVGYAHIVYDKYPCSTCGTRLKESSKNYFGPTKASVSLIYVIK